MSVEVGDVAPDFSLRDQDNGEVRLSDLRGRSVVLVFYPFDFSSVCTSELKQITATRQRYDAAGAEVFGISIDSRFAHAAFSSAEGLQVRLLADFHPKGEVSRLYGAYLDDGGFATRASFVIDKDGIVRYKVIGEVPKARDQDEYLAALAACPT